ncbi:hypothetical protein COBT_003141, partial [Conglomerata obtusa]
LKYNQQHPCYYIVIGYEYIVEDDIKKSTMFPAEISIIEIENDIDCLFARYNEQIFNLSRINDIFTMKNDQIVTYKLISSKCFDIILEPITDEVKRTKLLMRYKTMQVNTPEPYKTINLLLTSRLVDFIRYFDEIYIEKRNLNYYGCKKNYYHKILDQLENGELDEFIRTFIIKEMEKKKTTDFSSLWNASGEHDVIFDVEKFKKLIILFVKEIFIVSFKK